MRIVGISGNVKRPSKTKQLVETASGHLAARIGVQASIYDFVEMGNQLPANLDARSAGPLAREALKAVEQCDALLVATPVYKGSYAGILKHFFDFLDPLVLVDRPVLLMATGGGYRHALVVEHQLRPLFGFFSARTIAHGVYAADSDFQDGKLVDENVGRRLASAVDQLVSMLPGAARSRVPMPAHAG